MAIWEPTGQIGTPWVKNADANDVDVIFWLCFVKLIFGCLSALHAFCRRNQEYSELAQNDQKEGKRAQMGNGTNYTINVLQVIVPVLGICAIKLDSMEILKVSSIKLKSDFSDLRIRMI